ncbi:hypothetical protein [Novipirellula rosea]
MSLILLRSLQHTDCRTCFADPAGERFDLDSGNDNITPRGWLN